MKQYGSKRELLKRKVAKTDCTSIVELPNGYATHGKGDCVELWTSQWDHLRSISTDYWGYCNLAVLGEEELLVPDNNGSLVLIDLEANKRGVLGCQDTWGAIMCVKWLKKSNRIVLCYDTGTVTVSAQDGQILYKTELSDTPTCLDYNDRLSMLLIGTTGSRIWKFSFRGDSLRLEACSELTNPGVGGVSIRSDGKLAVVSCWDGRIRYFTTKTLKLVAVLEGRTVTNCVLFGNCEGAPDQSGLVFAGSVDGRITIWNLFVDKIK